MRKRSVIILRSRGIGNLPTAPTARLTTSDLGSEGRSMVRHQKSGVVSSIGLVAVFLAAGLELRSEENHKAYQQWRVYGGGPENLHYSALNQINRDNVRQLEVAWTYDTGDAFEGSEMQCNPIVVDGLLYVTTPKLRVLALDA